MNRTAIQERAIAGMGLAPTRPEAMPWKKKPMFGERSERFSA
jgi:hypothetical protein